MNKKPFILRSVFAVIVVAVFVASMFPLKESDFYKTFEKLLVNPADPVIQKVIGAAKELESSKKVYSSTAIDLAATEQGVNLTQHIKPVVVKSQKLMNNSDVISLVRKNAAGSIRLGIDLNGGAEFLLLLEPTDENKTASAANFDRFRDLAIETLRKRLEARNIFETEISPAGGDLVSLRVPIVTKDEKANLEKLIRMTAKLQFKLVHSDNGGEITKYLQNPETYQAPEGYVVMENVEIGKDGKLQKNYFLVDRETLMDGKSISDAFVQMDNFGFRQIAFSLNTEGAVKFGDITTKNVGRSLAIILDGKLYSAPNIKNPITGGSGVITGNFSKEDAENIANALVSGSVPFKIDIVSRNDIDPTIGSETVRDGLYSGIAGTFLVILFMIFYYRLSGIVATISLIVNALLILGALAAFDVTLTLPGIAGIILTIGMAVDANVLIYERIREELNNNKTIVNAVDIGFNRAFSAIFDSNLTTLFTALILLWQGTGAIKGFAMTLAIGIFTTLFTAVFLTRLLFDIMLRLPGLHLTTLRMRCMIKNPNINFLGHRKPALILSAIVVLGSLAVFAYKGSDMLGIDFTGGTQLEMDFVQMVPASDISSFLSVKGYDSKVTYKTTSAVDSKRTLEILIRPQAGADSKDVMQEGSSMLESITADLNKQFPEAKFKAEKQSTLGALIGETFTRSAIISIVLAMLGMFLYMTIRFELAYSVAANVAIVFDVITSVGIYVACGGQITLQVVASILTLIGYSVNDTIVTFDRQRENLGLINDMSYWDIINLSINQTFGRTILTSLSVFLILATQFCFGGIGIRDFIAVMLIGCVIGCYSSIYTASIIVAYWHKSKGRKDGIPDGTTLEEGSVVKA